MTVSARLADLRGLGGDESGLYLAYKKLLLLALQSVLAHYGGDATDVDKELADPALSAVTVELA